MSKAEKAVEKFNARNAIGCSVEYRRTPNAPAFATRTRSEAYVQSGHTAVVMIDGVSGCVALFAITAKP